MRWVVASSLIFAMISSFASEYNLSKGGKEYSIFVGSDDIYKNPYFNIDILAPRGSKVTMPSDFKNKFFVENFSDRIEGDKVKFRWIVSSKSTENFSIGEIKILSNGDLIVFKNIDFKGSFIEPTKPDVLGLISEKNNIWIYFCLVLIVSGLLFILFRFCFKKKIKKIFDSSDLKNLKNDREFFEKFIHLLNDFSILKLGLDLKGKTFSEILEILNGKVSKNILIFLSTANESIYSNTTLIIDDDKKNLLISELERMFNEI